MCNSQSLSNQDFIDIFVIDEAEPILNSFLDKYKELKKLHKELESFLSLKGIYIPSIDNKVEKIIVKIWIMDIILLNL